jgi:hypothetical protein
MRKLFPASVDLKREVDLEAEAAAFALPLNRVAEIADDVSEASGPVLEISVSRRESELRERFEELYDVEVAKRQVCPFVRTDGSTCEHTFTAFDDAMAHIRMHFVFDSGDGRLAESVLKHIEERIYPVEEYGLKAALGPEERKRLMSEFGPKLLRESAPYKKKAAKPKKRAPVHKKPVAKKKSTKKKKKVTR